MTTSRNRNIQYDPPTYDDAFTWLVNSGECGQEVLRYIDNLKKTSRIEAAKEMIDYFRTNSCECNDVHVALLFGASSAACEKYLRNVLMYKDEEENEQRTITETV